MNTERVAEALGGATDTRSVLVGEGTLGSVTQLFREGFGEGARAIVVADENTFRVAGEAVQGHLTGGGVGAEEPYVYPGEPALYAEYGNVERLVEALRTHEAVPVAVGSGTLNDLVKRAAHEAGRPYLCVGTAASMDGYTAFGASIQRDGYKQTLSCPAPRCVLADAAVLAAAPEAMTAAGYADLLGKITSGADWLVADALGVEALDPAGWSLVQDHLAEWTARPAGLRAGDAGAVDGLMEGLVMSGLAMQAYRSSRAGSGAEHQFSHLWEGEGLGRDRNPPLSHGFKVGVGTVAIAALYERVLARDLSRLDAGALARAWPRPEAVERAVREAHHEPGLREAAVQQSLAKHPDPDALAGRLEALRGAWPELRERLQQRLMPAATLAGMLREAGCPTTPEEIGLGREELRRTYRRARTIRSRYTVLDLAAEAGILEECVEEMFRPGGYWVG